MTSGRPPAPFVVGVGRSGTTLLRLMLDAHPELAIPPETHFVNPFIQASGRIRSNPQIACRTIVHDQRRRWAERGVPIPAFRAVTTPEPRRSVPSSNRTAVRGTLRSASPAPTSKVADALTSARVSITAS